MPCRSHWLLPNHWKRARRRHERAATQGRPRRAAGALVAFPLSPICIPDTVNAIGLRTRARLAEPRPLHERPTLSGGFSQLAVAWVAISRRPAGSSGDPRAPLCPTECKPSPLLSGPLCSSVRPSQQLRGSIEIRAAHAIVSKGARSSRSPPLAAAAAAPACCCAISGPMVRIIDGEIMAGETPVPFGRTDMRVAAHIATVVVQHVLPAVATPLLPLLSPSLARR